MSQNNSAVMAKTIGMFNVLTGKSLTEQEGFAFIGLWDIAEEHINGPVQPISTEIFTAATRVMDPPEVPVFIGRDAAAPGADKTATAVLDLTNDDADLHPLAPEPTTEPERTDADDVGDYDYTPQKQADIEAAWQSRDQQQAEEAAAVEANRVAQERKAAASRFIDGDLRDDHRHGYDWQVCALHREHDRSQSTVRVFNGEPTPEEFYQLFRLFDQRTHYVFINRWNPSRHEWEKFNDQYLKDHDREIRNLRGTIPRVTKFAGGDDKPLGRDVSVPPVSADWEQPEKPFRIRYYSEEAKAVALFYCDKKPSSREMAHFHHTKCLAVVQARPKA